jgi:hypothetical protein
MPRVLCKQEVSTIIVWGWRLYIPKGLANEGHEEIWSEREAITSLHWAISHSWEVWNRGIQAGVTTVIGRSPWHLSHIVAEEVLEGTHGCCISRSGTARVRFDISRALDQDLRSKESCPKVEDTQVLQDPMEQPYGRRSNKWEWRFSLFSPSEVWATVVRECAIVHCPIMTFLLSNLGTIFCFRGEGYNTPCI